MTWKSHIAIASAVIIPFEPQLLIVAVAGATAPDWIEYVLKFFGIKVKHRGATHYLYIPLLIVAFSFLFDFKNILFWFGIAYFTHWIADSLTISGVPISQFDNNKVHFFGGKIKTGEPIEYIISFSLLAFSLLVFNPMSNYFKSNDEIMKFNVYYINYEDLYDKRIIDEKEYKDKRFKLF